MMVTRKGSRLSVQPVTRTEFEIVPASAARSRRAAAARAAQVAPDHRRQEHQHPQRDSGADGRPDGEGLARSTVLRLFRLDRAQIRQAKFQERLGDAPVRLDDDRLRRLLDERSLDDAVVVERRAHSRAEVHLAGVVRDGPLFGGPVHRVDVRCPGAHRTSGEAH